MYTFETLLAAGALASVALAKPIPAPTTPNKGFSIAATVARPRPAFPVQLANAYSKYGAQVPDYVAAAAAKSTGSVVASPEASDVAYLCPVTIGGQTLNLDFDTGSADLWVFSSETSASSAKGHTIYDPSKSKTSKLQSGETWSISYGDGSTASGNVYTDTVTVGGLSVTGQSVELAKTVSSQFAQDTNNDGLLGLAFSSINTVKPNAATTWFQTGINQKLFAANLFTADLKHNAPGSYDFGYIDSSKYTGDIVYTDINNAQGFWEFTGTGYAVGSGALNSQSIDAIADTGTTLLLMDDSIVSDYYSNIQGATNSQSDGGYIFPCSATIPSFSLGIGSGQAVIPASLMSLGPVSAGSSSCFGGLQSNAGIGLSIYGDVFLKAVLAIFDQDNNRFGYAPKAGLSTGTTGGTSGGNSTGGDNPGNDGGNDGGNNGGNDGGNNGGDDGDDCDPDDWECILDGILGGDDK